MFDSREHLGNIIFAIAIYGNREVEYCLDMWWFDDLYFETFLN